MLMHEITKIVTTHWPFHVERHTHASLSGSRAIDIQTNIHVLINIYNAQTHDAVHTERRFIKNNEAASIILAARPRFDG